MPEYDLSFVGSVNEIENASRELLKLDQTLEDVSRTIQRCLQFDFVAIQLKNKEEKTIETVYGIGSSSEWSGLAKHTIQGERELWDIQADIVTQEPPRIEVIAGRDRRFDEFIFKKFKHKNQVRVFAPIILAPSEVNLEKLRWEVRKELQPNVDGPLADDRRTVLEMRVKDWTVAKRHRSEVIGTIEAGFYDATREISPSLAQQIAVMAGQRAGDIHRASLENVFRTIARSAMTMMRADAASLHFARADDKADPEFYIYEAWVGRPFPSVMSPRAEGLGQQALRKRQALFVPDKELGHDDQYLRKFYREAYDDGVRAQAAIPIFSEEGGDTRIPERQGLLYVRFATPHSFTNSEIAWLKLLALGAKDAIRRATYYTKERERGRRLTSMHHIAQLLADDPASPFLLDEIAGVALNILASDIVSVYEYEEQQEKFLSTRPTTAGRLIKPELITASVDERSAPALLLKTLENLYVDDAASHPILAAKRHSAEYVESFVARERVKSTAALILRGGTSAEYETPKEILGLMFVNYRTPHHFTDEDRKVTETLASTAAIAIRDRRIRSQTAERLEKAIRKIEAIGRAPGPRQADIARAIERIERIERAVEPIDRLSRLLSNPTLDNFDGRITVRIRDSRGVELPTEHIVEEEDSADPASTCVAAPEEACEAIVGFQTVERDSSSIFQKRLLIRDGNPAESVTFDVVLDSNSIEFTPDHATVTLKSKSDASSLSFTFKTPQEPGKHDILVEVGQKNRLVQVMRVSVTTRCDT